MAKTATSSINSALRLLAFCILIGLSSCQNGFGCYFGKGDNYQRTVCEQCRPGAPCMCIKIPGYPGGDIRGCWINQGSRPGCQLGSYQGLQVQMCLCEQDSCNSARQNSGPSSSVLLASVVGLVASYLARRAVA